MTNEHTTRGEIMQLGLLAMRLARVRRATLYRDGEPESDAEHSFMLSLVAASVARRYLPELNADKVAWKATIHDLLEAYTGDTSTLGASREIIAGKEQREREAMTHMKRDFAAWPELVTALEEYEACKTPEDRFVRVMDKVAAKITHLANDGLAMRRKASIYSENDYDMHVKATNDKLRRLAPDQAFALELLDNFIDAIKADILPSLQK